MTLQRDGSLAGVCHTVQTSKLHLGMGFEMDYWPLQGTVDGKRPQVCPLKKAELPEDIKVPSSLCLLTHKRYPGCLHQ